MNNVVFITSLPRTGTTSMRNMLEILGYKSYHTPLFKIFDLYHPGVAFSDTPAYVPSILEHFNKMPNTQNKFIYIDRDFESWFKSVTESTQILRTYERMSKRPKEDLTENQMADVKFYHEIFGDIQVNSSNFKEYIKNKFFMHREKVIDMGIVYSFDDRWESICEYLELEVPQNKEIPHLHNKSIGKKK